MAGKTTVGDVQVNFSAGTAEFIAGAEKVKQKISDVHSHTVSGAQAASASLRALSGQWASNTTAADNFLGKINGMGPILQAAFPIAGGLALVGVFGEMASKVGEVYEQFKKMQEAPEKIRESFSKLSDGIRGSNADLAVTNDRLANDIAKLEGKPQNGLKLAIDEATASSMRLSQQLRQNLDDVLKLVQQNQVGTFSFDHLIGGQAGTKDVTEFTKDNRRKQIEAQNAANQASENASGDEKKRIAAELKVKLDALDQEATAFARNELKKSEVAIASNKATLAAMAKDGLISDKAAANPNDNFAQRREVLFGIADLANQRILQRSLQVQNTDLTGQKAKDEAAKANSDLTKPFDKLMSDNAARLAAAKAQAAVNPTSDGLPSEDSASAKAYGDATKQIADLTSQHVKLTNAQKLGIYADNTAIQQTNLLTATKAKLSAVNKQLTDDGDNLNNQLAKDAQQHGSRMAQLDAEISATNKLTAAQALGPEAFRQAQIDASVAGISDPEEQAKARELAEARYQGSLAGTIEQLKRRVASTNAMSDAIGKSIEVQRAAELQDIRNSGQSQAVIDQQIALKNAQFAADDKQNLYGKYGTAAEGLNRTLAQMRNNIVTNGQMVNSVLGAAFNDLGTTMSQMLSGQEVSWGNFFQSVEAQLAKLALNNLFGSIAGALSSGTGFLGGIGSKLGLGSKAVTNVAGIGSSGGASIGLFGGFKAHGGSADAGTPYVVGDGGDGSGSELFVPQTAGTIVPHGQFGGGSGSVVINNKIDARGSTDPAGTAAQVKRALDANRTQSVQQAIAAQRELQRRRPSSRLFS